MLLSGECERLESMSTFILFYWVVISEKGRMIVFLFPSFSKMANIQLNQAASYMIILVFLLSYAGDDTNNPHFNVKRNPANG